MYAFLAKYLRYSNVKAVNVFFFPHTRRNVLNGTVQMSQLHQNNMMING